MDKREKRKRKLAERARLKNMKLCFIRTGKYGLYDRKAKIWLGNTLGAYTYNDKTIARIAASAWTVRLQYEAGRIRAKPFDRGANKLKDTITVTSGISGVEAIRRLEEGLVLA
jgi:hypothetical protein